MVRRITLKYVLTLNELIQYNLPVEIENRQYCICMHIQKLEMIEIIPI